MGNYVYGSSLSYADWLQSERLRSMELAIPRSTREIVASVEELARENVELHDGIQEGFDRVCFTLSEVSAGITELNATFHWGFSEVISSLGRVNDSLDELKRIAKTPAQTWAYEQYEIGRDAIRRRLWPEALGSLDRAINGLGDHPGYALEFRFHHSKGMIYLGNFRNADPAVIDLVKAEESFLAAGRYAKADYPCEAARCFLAAGWAAYCQGKMPEALNHTQRAVALHPRLPEAYFQAAKFEMHMDHPDAALPILRSAIDLDRLYAMKGSGDEDFRRHGGRIHNFMVALTEEARPQAASAMAAAIEELKRCDELNAEASDARAKLAEAKQHFATGTFFGYLDCKQSAQEAVSAASKAINARQCELDAAVWNKTRRAKLARFRLTCAFFFGIIAAIGLIPQIGCFGVLLGLLGFSGVGASLATLFVGDDEVNGGLLGAIGGGVTSAMAVLVCNSACDAATFVFVLVLGGFLGFLIGQAQSHER
mgnify:CR=1 FL=1